MWWWKKKHKEPEVPKTKGKWQKTLNECLSEYGSATKFMEEIFKDNPDWLRDDQSSPLAKLIIIYLREEYYRRNPE